MKELILLIMNQTTILFENIEETVDAIDETQLDKDGSWEWPLRTDLPFAPFIGSMVHKSV